MSALTDARATLKSDTESAKQYRRASDEGRIGLARVFARVRSLFTQLPNVGGKEYATFTDWAEEVAPGETRVNPLCNAGIVANVIGDDLGCIPSDRALTALYRQLAVARTSEEVEVAEGIVRDLWAQALAACDLKRGKAPTESQVLALVGDGSKGPKKSATPKKDAKPKSDAKASDEADADPAARESAAKETRRLVKKMTDADGDPALVEAVMTMTVKLCETYGVAVMFATCATLKQESREAAKIAAAASALVA